MTDFDDYIDNLVDTDPIQLGRIARGLEADGRAVREELEELRSAARTTLEAIDYCTRGDGCGHTVDHLRSPCDSLRVLIPETEEDRRRMAAAEARMAARLRRRKG